MTESAEGVDRITDVQTLQEIQERLELAPEEGLRLLGAGPWTVLLERVGGPSPAPAGAGAPALTARLGSFGLGDFFQFAEAHGKTGFLHFCDRDHAKSVYLSHGEVVFATSNQLVERLGESLLRAGVINLDQLREAQRCFTPDARFGKILVERGFLTPRELWNGVKHQVEEIVRSLFSYATGRIYFWEGEFPPDNVVRLSLPTRRLIEEGLQRRQELAKVLGVLADPRVQLVAVRDVDAELSGSERALFAAIPEEGRFPALCERLGIDAESAARSLQLLRLLGAVKLMRAPQAATPPPSEDAADGLRETLGGIVKLIAELAAAIATADGDDSVEARLREILQDAASRFPALFEGMAIGPGATLDPEDLGRRAAGVGEEAEAQAVAGLGELVAYLEFEVMNHPGIEDSEAVLRSVAHLRANLAA